MNTKKDEPEISIVVPVYNEEGNIDILVQKIIAAITPENISYELILVDDGSLDATWANICQNCTTEQCITGVRLSRNFGHQHALIAGLTTSKGKAIITLDGDLQHPPALIPKMIALWKQGYDIVNTIRHDKDVASPFKRWTSKLFYKTFSFMTNVSLSPGSSDFRLLSRKALTSILSFEDADLFLRGATQWVGFQTTTLSFDADHRLSGETKYSLDKMIKFALGAIVSFSVIPLKISIYIGLLTTFISFIQIGYVFVMVAQGETVSGWASTMAFISFLFGILFINLGILGAYLARFHVSLQKRPRFIIDETKTQ